jgi:subtilisin family serine protease
VAAASSNAMMRSGLPLRDASADAPPTDGARIVIVSLEARVHGRSRNLLSKWLPGAVIGNYIAHDSFAVLATPDDVLSAAAHPAIAHVGALDPEHKVSPSLLSGLGRARAARAYVRLWEMRMRTPSLPLTGILRRWRGSGGVLRRVAGAARPSADSRGFVISLPHDAAAALALLSAISSIEAVQWIEHAAADKQANAHAKPVLRGDHWEGGGIGALGIDGTGELVGVTDSGIDVDHCFFWDSSEPRLAVLPSNSSTARKVESYWPVADAADEKDGHGTHVVGSILGQLGSGGLWTPPPHTAAVLQQYGGIAPGARVAFTDVGLAVFQDKSAKGEVHQ